MKKLNQILLSAFILLFTLNSTAASIKNLTSSSSTTSLLTNNIKSLNLNIQNNTYYGSLEIKKGTQFSLAENESLIIDGDIFFDDFTQLYLPEGSQLIVTGSLELNEHCYGLVHGFILVKEQLKLGKGSRITGGGGLSSKKGVKFSGKASVFEINKSTKGFVSIQGEKLFKESAENKKDTVKEGTIDYDFEKATYSNKNSNDSSNPVLADNKMETIYLQQLVGDEENLLLTIDHPMQSLYKITLQDQEGKIISRKLAHVDNNTFQHEEELLHGAILKSGKYYVKVYGSRTHYVLPIQVR